MLSQRLIQKYASPKLDQLLASAIANNSRDDFMVFLDALEEEKPKDRRILGLSDSTFGVLYHLTDICPQVVKVQEYISNIAFLTPTFGSFTRIQQYLDGAIEVEYSKIIVSLSPTYTAPGSFFTAKMNINNKMIGGKFPCQPGKTRLWEVDNSLDEYRTIEIGSTEYNQLAPIFKEATDKANIDYKLLISLLEVPKASSKEEEKEDPLTEVKNESDVIQASLNYDKLLNYCDNFQKLAEAKVRSRGTVVFDAKSPSVKDNKDHFPINNEAQARNALARVNQYSSAPDWYKGDLKSLINAVYRKVHSKYPVIKVDNSKKKPGKG